jgi:hypothetical protein
MVFTQPPTSTLPKLWISDIIAGRQLAPFFNGLYSPLTPPTGTPTGHHILSLDPDTPEIIWKTIGYKLLNAGCSVGVVAHLGHFASQPLEWCLADTSLDDVMLQMLEVEVSWEEWVEGLSEIPLTLKEALELAELALVKLKDIEQLNIELDSLRRRAKVSEYKWDKEYLARLRAKLEKTLSLPSAQSAINIEAAIDELIIQGASGSYLTGQLNRLAAASQVHVQELRVLFYERSAECDLESDHDDNKSLVENLLNLGDQSLELRDFLPEDLAEPLKLWCSWLSIRPEVALTALLAGVSSLHKVGTELVIHRNQAFRVPPTICAGLVSESGQKKSPILWNIIRHPLNELRQEKIDAYNAAMEDYKAAMEVWNQSEDKGPKPEQPKDPTLYYFTNATGEAIPAQAGKAPEKTMLALIDELSGLFNSANSYRGGRGSDKQDILSYFDGSGQTVLRAGGIKVDVHKIYLSIFGTIQPEVLKNHIADCCDPDGQWARFLFVNQPLVAATLSDDDGQFVEVRDRLTGVYRQIDQLPEIEYRLSRPAFKRYQKVYNLLEKLRVTHPKPGMRAVYSKMEGYIGRLALNLHVMWELSSGKVCPDVEIPLFIMDMAIQLAKFFIGQVRLVHSFSDEEGLAPGVVKLFELSKRLDTNGKDGWVKPQQYRELFAAKKRPPAQQVRNLMLEAQSLGYGRTRGTGNRLEYHWRCDNNNSNGSPLTPPDNLGKLGKLRENLGNPIPYAETSINQGLQDNLGNLGKDTPNCSTSSCGYIPQQTEEEFHEEGGYIPEASLSAIQESCDIDTVVNIGLGNNLGNGFPNSSLSSLNEETEDAPEAAEATPIVETSQALVVAPVNAQQLREADYSSFPVNNPRMTESVRGTIAGIIRNQILAIDSPEAYEALRDSAEFTKEQLNWVRKNLLTKEERAAFQAKVVGSAPSNGNRPAQPERLFKNGDRVRYQHWCGRFGGYVRSGCLVVFDKSKSTTKLYGPAPTEPLAESELVLIKRANFLPEQ